MPRFLFTCRLFEQACVLPGLQEGGCVPCCSAGVDVIAVKEQSGEGALIELSAFHLLPQPCG